MNIVKRIWYSVRYVLQKIDELQGDFCKAETFLSFEDTILPRKTPKILFNRYQGLLDRACDDRVLP